MQAAPLPRKDAAGRCEACAAPGASAVTRRCAPLADRVPQHGMHTGSYGTLQGASD